MIYLLYFIIGCIVFWSFWNKELFEVLPLRFKLEFITTTFLTSLFWLPGFFVILYLILIDFIKGETLESNLDKTAKLIKKFDEALGEAKKEK